MDGEPAERLDTERLTLLPATAERLRAELSGRTALAHALAACVPDTWPPRLFDRQVVAHALAGLEASAHAVGWWPWYVALRSESQPLLILGIVGFKGEPATRGTVEIGYSVLRDHRRRGYATEAVGGLLRWAFSHVTVNRVIAETDPASTASIRVLERNRFRHVGPGSDPRLVCYDRMRWE